MTNHESEPAGGPAVPSWLADFLASREWTCNQATVRTYAACLGPFAAWLGTRPVSPLTVGAYLAHRRALKRSHDTLQNDYRMLKTCCRWLVEQGQLDRDPFSGAGRVRPLARKRRRRLIYSEADITRLLTASRPVAANNRGGTRERWADDGPLSREQPQSRALVLLLVDSAMRAGEVAALCCGQIRRAELIIRGKGDHEDVVFLSPPTRQALLDLAGDRPDDAPLFRDWRGKRCTTRGLRGIVERLAERAGVELPPRPLHAFRHYAGRGWAKAGVPDLAIQQLMRHASLATTRIYTELEKSDLAELHGKASPIGRLLAAADGSGAH